MSQHYFLTTYAGQPVTVTLGWDRPLGRFFMFVEPSSNSVEASSEPQEHIYSTLDEGDWQKAFPRNWTHIKGKLAAMRIDVSSSMFHGSEQDRCRNVGNQNVWHKADGSFSEVGYA